MATFEKTITDTADLAVISVFAEMGSLAGKLLENYAIALHLLGAAGTGAIQAKIPGGELADHTTAIDVTGDGVIVFLSEESTVYYREAEVIFTGTGATNSLRISLVPRV